MIVDVAARHKKVLHEGKTSPYLTDRGHHRSLRDRPAGVNWLRATPYANPPRQILILIVALSHLDCRAADMAVRLRQPPEGCLFHSDRGSQYCSYDYQKKLQAHGLRPSMSGKGNCYDNASVETFFKSLKAELIWRQKWPTRRQAEAAIFQYINGFYNTRRRHSYLGGISPLAFEAKVA